MLRHVRPSNLQKWVAANAPGSLKPTGKESWRAYLAANGGTGATLRDLEMSFLAGQSATGGTLADRWTKYLTAESGSKGSEKARNKYK